MNSFGESMFTSDNPRKVMFAAHEDHLHLQNSCASKWAIYDCDSDFASQEQNERQGTMFY